MNRHYNIIKDVSITVSPKQEVVNLYIIDDALIKRAEGYYDE